jgi:RNA exonuclease 4
MSAYASNWSRMQSKVTKKKVYRGPVEVAEKQESEKKGKQKKKSLSAIARATWSNAVEDANSRKQVKLEDVLGLSSELGPSSTSSTGATSHVAMDCEMVGAGPDGQRSILARCSLVNFHGHILYDKFVQPKERVTDFRTEFSGIRYNDILKNPEAVTFEQCQKDVFPLLRSRVLIGHSIQNDLKVLMLDHPGNMIRDTAYYKGLCPHRPISLKHLMDTHLNVGIQ